MPAGAKGGHFEKEDGNKGQFAPAAGTYSRTADCLTDCSFHTGRLYDSNDNDCFPAFDMEHT